MNNADMPMSPVPENLEGYYKDPKTCTNFHPFMGLTKREYFAGLAMQAMITNPHWETSDSISNDAVYAADALLAKLEDTK